MKVVHIESGLGNQMLSYCEYLALKKMNPDDQIYIETIIYEIPECNEFICQWNGYELERLFGIKAPNIKELFSESEWSEILDEVKASDFWNKNWNYPVYFTKILKKHGLDLENYRGDFEAKGALLNGKESNTLKSKIGRTRLGYWIKRMRNHVNRDKLLTAADASEYVFARTERNLFTGQRLAMKHKNNHIEVIDSEIRNSFEFKPFNLRQNQEMADYLKNKNSVAIHARRGDMLSYNADCYKYGYFERAVKYIKQHVENPVFVFFCDPGSIEWCKQNEKIFGLDFRKDEVRFVDWNKGTESYRDMQLMAMCKHQIITNSSFGWWAAFLNQNPDKITISPDITINTTHHF